MKSLKLVLQEVVSIFPALQQYRQSKAGSWAGSRGPTLCVRLEEAAALEASA